MEAKTRTRKLVVEESHPAEERRRAFVCARCGYGAAGRSAPPRCPMCGGSEWVADERARRHRARITA